ncbi:MAG: prolyl-tRNA synthetase associated domain-containing protein, partial [Clostridia bacterium]|nr:prolyl-tRNA synthetase associated domain-containing protein [Clostridia bacterium]
MEKQIGRPLNAEQRLAKEIRSYDLLDSLGITYARVDHEHADTMEMCARIETVLGAKICKNLL